jgi:hypothetical protein
MDIDTLVEVCLEKVHEQRVRTPLNGTEEDMRNHGAETLDKYRCDLEPYVWQHLMVRYGAQLDTYWKTHTFAKKSTYAWVIVERRAHPNWWFLLRNILWAAPHFSLYIFCSDQNIKFVKALLGDKVNDVHIISWYEGFATRQEGKDQYAITFKNPSFYKHIDAEYMIRVEVDTYLRHKIPEGIFMGDYYGAPWAWAPEKPGGGGLIIRNIKNMIELCERENHSGIEADDAWIGDKLIVHGYTFPPFEVRSHIFSENFPVPNPIGVHQFWTFLENFNIGNPSEFKGHLDRYLTIHLNE